MALLYGRAGRLTAENGGFWPGQERKAALEGVDLCSAAGGLSAVPAETIKQEKVGLGVKVSLTPPCMFY